MSINSLENVTKYSDALDKLFIQKSATGFFADTDMAKKFVGAKTVIVPDINFQGLSDYDRDNGFSRGAITVANTSYTMQMDRARSLQIDREDMDEIGIANLAGKILGEYVRTKVVPECDAYVISKLASIAVGRENVYRGSFDKPVTALISMIQNIQEKIGYDEELVAFVDSFAFAKIQQSEEISHYFAVNDFKQGDINLRVYTFNGVPIIPVVSSRMKTAFNFDNAEGGFAPAENARQVHMLVCPKKGAHLVCKTEKMRIFTPEQNVDADAYKFDYRIYYDLFVKKNELENIWVWVSPEFSVTTIPEDYADGSSTPFILASCNGSNGNENVEYQWYEATDSDGSDLTPIIGANSARYDLPINIESGTHYYAVKCIVNRSVSKLSRVVAVDIA